MENVPYEYFKQIDLRIGQIKQVEDIAGADRLYKLKVDIGEERQMVAGVKQFYAKEELVGKKVVVLANLAPKVIRGIESHGMIFAATTSEKEKLGLIVLDKDLPNGTQVL